MEAGPGRGEEQDPVGTERGQTPTGGGVGRAAHGQPESRGAVHAGQSAEMLVSEVKFFSIRRGQKRSPGPELLGLTSSHSCDISSFPAAPHSGKRGQRDQIWARDSLRGARISRGGNTRLPRA